jgi:hypothetical protein
LGRAVHAARAEGRDPVRAAADLLGARHLIFGRIESLQEEERVGFYFTTAQITGLGPDAGRTARLTIKNEAMLCSLDERPVTIFPDPIYLLEPKTGRGLMSIALTAGHEITLLGASAHPRLRAAAMTEAGRKAFSPARFGHPDLIYRPMEALLP